MYALILSVFGASALCAFCLPLTVARGMLHVACRSLPWTSQSWHTTSAPRCASGPSARSGGLRSTCTARAPGLLRWPSKCFTSQLPLKGLECRGCSSSGMLVAVAAAAVLLAALLPYLPDAWGRLAFCLALQTPWLAHVWQPYRLPPATAMYLVAIPGSGHPTDHRRDGRSTG